MIEYKNEWRKFKGTEWKESINVAKFIEENYKEYTGDDSFLVGTTKRTDKVWSKCTALLKKEMKVRLLDVELKKISGITSFEPGYIDKPNEVIVGL